MDQIGESPRYTLVGFKPLVLAVQLLGIIGITLVIIWSITYRGGYSWTSNPNTEFNWHPLLMIVGLVFLYGNGMLIYRTQRNLRKRRLKLMHGGIMLFILVLTIVALQAAFDSHNLQTPPYPNMYSLHSWIGLTSVILFCCQWLVGCFSFFYPGIHAQLRASYLPIHVYFGVAGFIGATAACLLGLNEKAFFVLREDYSKFVGEGVLINAIGLVLTLFSGLTVYLVSKENYRRLPTPEDDSLLTGNSQ